MFDCFELSKGRTGGVQKKPANEGQPQTGEAGAVEEAEESDNDKCKRYELTDRRRDAGGARGTASDPPDSGAQHPPTVKRKSGNHIKDCQQDINYAEPT